MQPKSSTPNPLTSGPEKQEVFENKELKRQFEFICPSNQMKLIPDELENNFIEDIFWLLLKNTFARRKEFQSCLHDVQRRLVLRLFTNYIDLDTGTEQNRNRLQQITKEYNRTCMEVTQLE